MYTTWLKEIEHKTIYKLYLFFECPKFDDTSLHFKQVIQTLRRGVCWSLASIKYEF